MEIKIKPLRELKEEMLKNKEKFIGKLIYTTDGWVCRVVDINENGIEAIKLFRCDEQTWYMLVSFMKDKEATFGG